MWLFTTIGFFSIVTAEEFGEELQVRARSAQDLDRLRDRFMPGLGESISKPGRDYPWRAFATRDDVAAALAAIGEAIDYSNFKDAVAKAQGYERAHVYQQVWSAAREIEHVPPEPSHADPVAGGTHSTSAETPVSSQSDYAHRDLHAEGEWPLKAKPRYGGVLFNREHQVLLREPRGHFDGYHWTFAKGTPEPQEAPMDAALREVAEETGYHGQVVSHVPGAFQGSPNGSANYFYVMLEAGIAGDGRLHETSAVRWVSQYEAKSLIGETTNAGGRERDLRILDAAHAAFAAWRSAS